MKRRGFEKKEIHAIRRAYKALYRSGKTVEEAKLDIAAEAEQFDGVKLFLNFLDKSERGIITLISSEVVIANDTLADSHDGKRSPFCDLFVYIHSA